jgi:hypothetical protein
MNRKQRREAEKISKGLIERNPEVALLARQSVINDMCKGEFDTEFYRALANVKMDLIEGKITQERFDELTKHLLKPETA